MLQFDMLQFEISTGGLSKMKNIITLIYIFQNHIIFIIILFWLTIILNIKINEWRKLSSKFLILIIL